MGRIQTKDIHPSLHQSSHPVQHILGGADGSADQQTPLLVTGRIGINLRLFNILNGDKALQAEILIYNGQLLNFMPAQDLLGLCQCGTFRCSDQILLGHHAVDQLGHIGLKFHIPVGNDANQLPVVADRHAGNLILGAQFVRLRQRVAGSQPERICNNAILTALDHVHLLSLSLNGHILVDDADTALPCHGYGHAVFRHGSLPGQSQWPFGTRSPYPWQNS